MYEYGHCIQNQRYGLAYLISVGILSILGASKSQPMESRFINEKWLNLSTHNTFWLKQMQIVRLKNILGKYYGVDWEGDKYFRFPLHKP